MATKVNNIWQYVVYDAFGKCVAEYGQLADGLGGVKYVQQDWQGSVRTVTNGNGFVVSRTDHQAFGGEVGYGVGKRTIEQSNIGDPRSKDPTGHYSLPVVFPPQRFCVSALRIWWSFLPECAHSDGAAAKQTNCGAAYLAILVQVV